MSPEDVIKALDLTPHPEGGHFREMWRDTPTDGSRGAGTAIYYLLRAGERSQRHRIDATEIWHHYAGDALELTIDGATVVLGHDLARGERPLQIVPPKAWQSARPLGAWTLVGCTVSPAFEFEHFELDPDDEGTAS